MSEKIHLRLVIIDGQKCIVDQDERVVSRVVNIVSESPCDDVSRLTIQILESTKEGRVHINSKKNSTPRLESSHSVHSTGFDDHVTY